MQQVVSQDQDPLSIPYDDDLSTRHAEDLPQNTIIKALSISSLAALTACGGETKSKTTSPDNVLNDMKPSNNATVNASSSNATTTPSNSSSPNSTYRRSIETDMDAAQFLQQAQFSSTALEIAEAKKMGAEAWLNQQIGMPASQFGWDWLMSEGVNNQNNSGRRELTDAAIWYQLIKSPDQLRKRLALALSEILVVSSEAGREPARSFHAIAYWDLLNTHAFGNFRDLLEAVTLSPMMGVFLGTLGNRGPNPARNRVPDENYAREIMQLFSIGIYELNLDGTIKKDASGKSLETYDQADIMALANVFTGWVLDSRQIHTVESPNAWRVPMVMNEVDHSTLAVSCLKKNGYAGITIPANAKGTDALKIALDALFKHPNVGPFICKQLIQRLVTSNPTKEYVRDVASIFNNNGQGVRGDLAAVIKAILLHPESTGKTNTHYFGKIREPMLRYVQWARTFNTAPLVSGTTIRKWIDLAFESLGMSQIPLRPPTVFNFFRPGFVPANSNLSTQGLVAPEFQIIDELRTPAYANFIRECITNAGPGNQVLRADYADLLPLSDVPVQLVERLMLMMNAGRFARRDKLISAVSSIPSSRSNYKLERIYFTLIAIMISTDYLVQR